MCGRYSVSNRSESQLAGLGGWIPLKRIGAVLMRLHLPSLVSLPHPTSARLARACACACPTLKIKIHAQPNQSLARSRTLNLLRQESPSISSPRSVASITARTNTTFSIPRSLATRARHESCMPCARHSFRFSCAVTNTYATLRLHNPIL